MARKGVLLTDPSVAEMSYLQWHVEALAIRRKERDEREERNKLVTDVYKAAYNGLREMAIRILGLHIGAGKAKEGEPTPFRSLLPFIAREGMMEELMAAEADEKTQADALNNPDLDALADSLMDFDVGDLEPLFTGANSDDPDERWNSPEHQAMLRSLGIEIVDGEWDPTANDKA